MAVVAFNTPSALVRSLQAAVLPFIDDQGEGMREGVSIFHVYKAVAPLLPGYTVADVAPVANLVRNAMSRAAGRGLQSERLQDAFYQVLTIAEYFVAYARSSGPDCVAARAAVLTEATEDDGVLCDRSTTVAAKSLQDDIATLTAGGPFNGERFDDFAKGVSGSSWLYEALFDAEKQSCIDVNEMRAEIGHQGDAA